MSVEESLLGREVAGDHIPRGAVPGAQGSASQAFLRALDMPWSPSPGRGLQATAFSVLPEPHKTTPAWRHFGGPRFSQQRPRPRPQKVCPKPRLWRCVGKCLTTGSRRWGCPDG